MNYFSRKLLLLYVFLISGSLASENFTVDMTYDQYSTYFSAYIAEFNHKKCYVRPGSDVNACVKYCLHNYDYVPSLPYKNAQAYNPQTRLCEPRIFCPRQDGITYDEKNRKCIDTLLGFDVPPLDAPVPTYKATMKVTIICQNGKVKSFNGKPDCQCDMGFGSLPSPFLGQTKSFMKCNEPLSIAVYFPNFLKIYYDESYDNLFPFAADSNYWVKLVEYYLRSIKYSVLTFFVPYQVQIVLLAIPAEPTFRPADWIWVIWLAIFFSLLLGITLYQKCLVKLKELSIEE